MDLLNTALPALGEAFFLLLQPQQLLYLHDGSGARPLGRRSCPA